jgi:flagellar protein FliS
MNAYARQAYNAYQKTEVFSVSPGELIAKLLVAAEAAVKKGLDAMRQGEVAKKGEQFGRAIAILGELQSSLDFEKGGDVAQNLNSIYDYCIREILFGNMKNDPARIETVLKTLEPIIDAWMAIKSEPRPQEGEPEAVEEAPQKALDQPEDKRLQAAL